MEDYTSESCQKEFSKERAKLLKLINKADFEDKEDVAIDGFNDICLRASKNDPVAQDYLAYIFKKGLTTVVPVNYTKYMEWEILAASNGNQFAIDKLSLFLNYALNEIMFAEDISYIINRNNLTSENYTYVIGRLICEAIADELMLEPENLIKQPLTLEEFNPRGMRVFDRARNFIIPKVLKFLRN